MGNTTTDTQNEKCHIELDFIASAGGYHIIYAIYVSGGLNGTRYTTDLQELD